MRRKGEAYVSHDSFPHRTNASTAFCPSVEKTVSGTTNQSKVEVSVSNNVQLALFG